MVEKDLNILIIIFIHEKIDKFYTSSFKEVKLQMKTLRIYITGSVQGVFFRKYLEDKANELNIRGFCRNLEDGRIEVVVEGRDEKVNDMLEVCKTGSPHSDVKDVQISELKHQGFKGFKVMHF